MSTLPSHSPSKVTIQVTRDFTVPPERVFDAWLDPKSAGHWLFATPAGRIKRVEIDGRVGGNFTIVDQREGTDIEHTGTYETIDRPRRLVFTFLVPKYSSDATKVALDITPAPGGCHLTLTHEGVWADYAERTKQGWTKMLDELSLILSRT